MCSCSLLQGIFPTQGSNSGLPHCRWILYQLRHKGSTVMLAPTQYSKLHTFWKHKVLSLTYVYTHESIISICSFPLTQTALDHFFLFVCFVLLCFQFIECSSNGGHIVCIYFSDFIQSDYLEFIDNIMWINSFFILQSNSLVYEIAIYLAIYLIVVYKYVNQI